MFRNRRHRTSGLETGNRGLETGNWRLETGNWNLAVFNWPAGEGLGERTD